MTVPKLVPANQVPRGACFRKQAGSFWYLRVSDSSVKHYGLSCDQVWGICYNGNVTTVDGETMVHIGRIGDMIQNVAEEQQWNRDVGARATSRP